jgi:hypothetical protein
MDVPPLESDKKQEKHPKKVSIEAIQQRPPIFQSTRTDHPARIIVTNEIKKLSDLGLPNLRDIIPRGIHEPTHSILDQLRNTELTQGKPPYNIGGRST